MASFACSTLSVAIDPEGVAEIVLNRPHVHNALDETLITELTQVLTDLAADPRIRVLCLRGQGPSFCAGADLACMQKAIGYSKAQNVADAYALGELFNRLYHFPKPSLALVHGAVYGGGVGLVACCDIALATSSTIFCLAEVKLGLVPATIAPYVMEAVGPRVLRYWMLTAEPFSAAQAQECGLLHGVWCTLTEVEQRKLALIKQLLQHGPQALGAAKQLIQRVNPSKLDDALSQELAELIAGLRVSEEAQARLLAFIEHKATRNAAHD